MTQVELLTPEELAAQLRYSTSTLKRWRQRKIGPPWIRVVGGVRYPAGGITAWLNGMPGKTFEASTHPVGEPEAIISVLDGSESFFNHIAMNR